MEKVVPMIVNKSGQFHYENLTWERSLDFFKQENAFLKTRLSEVVDIRTDSEFLSLAEQFQNRFIVKDEFIDELRHDIHTQEEALARFISSSTRIDENKLIKKQEKLRNEMEFFEKDFAKLKNEFNKYLAGLL